MASNLLFNVTGVLSAAVANLGTFTVGYPQDPQTLQTLNLGYFGNAVGHKFVLGQNTVLSSPNQFSLTFGASNITVTNRSGSTWPINSTFGLQLEIIGGKPLFDVNTGNTLNFVSDGLLAIATLGSPAAASATAILNAVTTTVANNLSTPYYMNCGGGRAATIKSSSASDTAVVITVTGTDIYGVAMSEAFTTNGTSAVNGKKAFNIITSITSSATMVGTLSVGTADILGLPFFLPGTGYVLRELENGAAPTAGTFVAGVQTAGGSTTTTGDVRGTWAPNSATDASKSFKVIAALPDPGYLGMAQA